MKQSLNVFQNTTKLLANKPIANGQLEKNSKEKTICAFQLESQRLLKVSLNVPTLKILQLAIFKLAKFTKDLKIKLLDHNVFH
jgi:hypothetical protein